MTIKTLHYLTCVLLLSVAQINAQTSSENKIRQRISINDNWHFYKYDSLSKADDLIYDVRPKISDPAENRVADAKPTEAVKTETIQNVLKPWILPMANRFIKDPLKRHIRPEGNPGNNFPFAKSEFDDGRWEKINSPHHWSIKGPFMTGTNPEVGGGMGRLPSHGVAWYQKKLDIQMQATDANGRIAPRSNNSIELSIEGPGEIISTDNGDPTNMASFSSNTREAFNGLCLWLCAA